MWPDASGYEVPMSQLRRGDASPDAPVPTKKSGTGGPDHPLELSKNDWKMTLKRTMKEVKDDRITLVAAGMAFYWFLAVFPALIAAVGVVDLLGLGQQMLESINQAIGSTIPGGAAAILTTTIEAAQDAPRRTSLVAAIIGVTLALFGATAGMVALQAGLDVAYDVAEDRKFFKKRAYALLLVVATGLLIAIPSVFFAAGGLIWSILGWLTLVAAIITLFAVFYYLGPNREKPDWKWVSPGGLLGAFIFLLVSGGFSIYVGNFARYGETYGTFAGVVILLFWMYLSAIAILVGGELNSELERQTAMREGRA